MAKAIELQTAVVDARSQSLGQRHAQTLQAMDQLGKSYWLHGMHQKALEIQQRTVDDMLITMGPEHALYKNTLAA